MNIENPYMYSFVVSVSIVYYHVNVSLCLDEKQSVVVKQLFVRCKLNAVVHDDYARFVYVQSTRQTERYGERIAWTSASQVFERSF